MKKYLTAIAILFAVSELNAIEVIIAGSQANPLVLEVSPETTLECLKTTAETLNGELLANQIICINDTDVGSRGYGYNPMKPVSSRDYFTPLSSSDKQNISYIVKTLGNKSLAKIILNKSAIEKAGDSVNHVHPLKFLACIFMDEELKVGIRNVRKKYLIWDDFFSGIRGSLTEEADRNNLLPAHVADFAASVGIDADSIQPLIASRKWKEFVDVLIAKIPRKGDPSKYGM